ncbi:MAG: DUF427 domain-containing protein [Acidobacteriota bacterium]
MRPRPASPGPGQESVWDYPRPPALEPSDEHVVIRLGETVLADTRSALRLLETSHPPTYYVPPDAVDRRLLVASARTSHCEWKGRAHYVHIDPHALGSNAGFAPDERLDDIGWFYPSPVERFAALRDHYAFYPARLDCRVDGERVEPQAGGFYGGWITSRVVGPFKGEPGSWGW